MVKIGVPPLWKVFEACFEEEALRPRLSCFPESSVSVEIVGELLIAP